MYGFNRWVKDGGGFGGIVDDDDDDDDVCIKDVFFKAVVKVEEVSKTKSSKIMTTGDGWWQLEGGMVGIRYT